MDQIVILENQFPALGRLPTHSGFPLIYSPNWSFEVSPKNFDVNQYRFNFISTHLAKSVSVKMKIFARD